jgi:transposase
MHTAEDFKQLSKKASDSRMKMRYLALYHFQRGYNRTQIAEMLGVARGSVNSWVASYLSGGLDALQVRTSPGRPVRLSTQQLEQLKTFIENNAVKPEGGRLIAEDVRCYIQATFGVEYQQTNVYRLMRMLGFSWITSRSKHPKQSIEAQEAFKKLHAGNDPSHPRTPTS